MALILPPQKRLWLNMLWENAFYTLLVCLSFLAKQHGGKANINNVPGLYEFKKIYSSVNDTWWKKILSRSLILSSLSMDRPEIGAMVWRNNVIRATYVSFFRFVSGCWPTLSGKEGSQSLDCGWPWVLDDDKNITSI